MSIQESITKSATSTHTSTHVRNAHSLSFLSGYSFFMPPSVSVGFFNRKNQEVINELTKPDEKRILDADAISMPPPPLPLQNKISSSERVISRPKHKSSLSVGNEPESPMQYTFPSKSRSTAPTLSTTIAHADRWSSLTDLDYFPSRERTQSLTSRQMIHHHNHTRMSSSTSSSSSSTRPHLSSITNFQARESYIPFSSSLPTQPPPSWAGSSTVRRAGMRKHILRSNPKSLSTYTTASISSIDDHALHNRPRPRSRTQSNVSLVSGSDPETNVQWKRWSGYDFGSYESTIDRRRSSTVSLMTNMNTTTTTSGRGYSYLSYEETESDLDADEDDNDVYCKTY